MMSRRVLVIAPPEYTRRAHGLGQGLAALGHEVRYAAQWSPAPAAEVALCVGWSTLAALGRLPCPTVLDLPAAALAAETPGPALKPRVLEKLAALRLADYFTCAAPRQRLYFGGWLALAGVPDTGARLAVVPDAVDGDAPRGGAPLAGELLGAAPLDALAPATAQAGWAALVAPVDEFVRAAVRLPEAPPAPAQIPSAQPGVAPQPRPTPVWLLPLRAVALLMQRGPAGLAREARAYVQWRRARAGSRARSGGR